MTLSEMQKEAWRNKVDKGGDGTPMPVEFCHLYGKMSAAVEAWQSDLKHYDEELANIVICVLGLAERADLSLHDAVVKRLAKDANRSYYTDKFGIMCKIEGE